MKLALVHDFLVQNGGAENVLKALHELWPDAPIYTIVYDKERVDSFFHTQDIRPSFLQNVPFGVKRYQWFLPLMPQAVERLNLMDYDVVISSSSAFAKGVITRPETLHLCYCHTPTRYLWTDTHTYLEERRTSRFVKRFVPFMLTNLRVWDRLTADRVTHFLANSKNIQSRILKYYGKQSHVIYPPVSVAGSSVFGGQGAYYLAGGRLVSYKRFDLLVHAFNRLNLPLKIFGTGPEYAKLRLEAKENIEWLGEVSEEEKWKLYRGCVAFLHPQEEDFGMTAVEAMAAGRPVIAYRRGGALETVRPGVTGEFFDEQTWEALAYTLIHFKPEQYAPSHIREHALQFDVSHFKEKMKRYVEEAWTTFCSNN